MSDTDKTELRPAVKWFAEKMEQSLRRNDHKGGWGDCPLTYLTDRLHQEVRELEEAIERLAQNGYNGERAIEVVREAADVGNFAMMIADNVAGYFDDMPQGPKVRRLDDV